jgi:protein-S-isoprenylcysteine O-methyltransferase Ste14
MKIQKNPIIGVILGTGFMVLGILQIVYPELDGADTPHSVSFAKLIGVLLFIAGLAQVCYIEYKRREVC